MPNRHARRNAARIARVAAKQVQRIAARRDAPRPFKATGARAKVQAAVEGEGKLATFEGVAYTGAPMKPGGWYLPIIIDLDGVTTRDHSPALRQHDHEQIVGHTTSVKVTAAGVEVAGVFSGEAEHVAKVVGPAKNDFPWQMSVGANPIRTEFLEAGEEAKVNGRTVTGPMTISRETEIEEYSFVPLGADGDTSATVAASKEGRGMNWKIALKALMAELRAAKKAAKYTDSEIDDMDAEAARAALKKCMADDDDDDDDDDDASESARRQALTLAGQQVLKDLNVQAAAQIQRHAAILKACADNAVVEIELDGKKVNLAAHAIAENWTIERTELAALKAARPNGRVGVPGGLAFSKSTPEVTEAVLEAAVFHAGRHQFQLDSDAFYLEATPDGKGMMRRVPEYLEAETRKPFRAKYTDQVQQAAHDHFKGRIGPQEIIRVGLQAAGYGRSMSWKTETGVRSILAAWGHYENQNRIEAEGASNLSISNILANVMNKFALQGYLFTEQAWREFCAIRSVNDFKPAKSINLLGNVLYQQVGSSGELANLSFGDQAFANQAALFGLIGTLPWMHLVNDDLGMLTGAPMKIGQGAGLALNDNIFTLMKNMAAGTTLGDDGVSFWRTSSDTTAASKSAGKAYKLNKFTGGGSALSSTSLTTAKAAFDNQLDPNGNPLGFDGLMPILLFPPTLWRPATELLRYNALAGTGQTATPLQPDGNVWAGLMKPVMSRYLENANYVNSATGWYVLFNPVALAILEVCFLNGVDTPTVLQASPEYQFDRLGVSIRGTMPFGSNQQNFRGGVFSAGA